MAHQLGDAMKLFRFPVLAAAMLALTVHAAHAVEFKSVGAAPAILYDAPTIRGKKVFIAPRNMPLEVVFTYGEWSKVRDVMGDLSWVESKQLTAKRTVVVNTLNAKIHAAADEASPVVFTTDKGVVLDISEPVASGWVKVKHSDGQSGFIKITDVWGV
jgi:SH3-like domain-containing protein